jgi:hypothetical protein
MAKVTYRAPEGDEDRVTMLGYRFFDGQPVEVENTAINPFIVDAFKKNKFFDVADIEIEAVEVIKRGPGRPPKAVDHVIEESGE